jgi:hypothetical protein
VCLHARVGVDLRRTGDGLLTVALLEHGHSRAVPQRARNVHGAERARTHWRVQALVQRARDDCQWCAAAVVRVVHIRHCVAGSEGRIVGVIGRARVVVVVLGANI